MRKRKLNSRIPRELQITALFEKQIKQGGFLYPAKIAESKETNDYIVETR